MLSYRFLVSALAFFLFSVPVCGQPSPDVDLRTYSEKGEYYLVFNALRSGTLGHAFVTWLAEDPDQRMSVAYARGLWPVRTGSDKKKVRVLNGAIDGGKVEGYLALYDTEGDITQKKGKEITLDGYINKGDVQLVVQVNSGAFNKAKNIKERWDEAEDYKLLRKDCVSFIDAVAESVGLETPSGTFNYPGEYVAKLKQMN